MVQCWCLGLATEAGFPVSCMESLNSGYLESLFYNVGDGVMKVSLVMKVLNIST
jgi:hypothetical protein